MKKLAKLISSFELHLLTYPNPKSLITLVCEVLKVKHAIADSMVVSFAKSKNCTHFLQSGQVFEIQDCNGIVCSSL